MKEGKFQSSSTKKPSNLGVPSFFSYGNQVVHLSELEQISRIGSSSRGTVYKVIHRPTGKFYALKVIYGDPTESYHQISREIDTLRNVDNPNVVQCHDIFYLNHNRKIHVLSELMDKGSLEGRHIPNEKNLTGLTHQLLQGLANLHDLGYVHRDIKPSNLLINSRKKVKIADFGVSQILAQSMDCYLLVGKIPYMCPERINPDINQGQRDSYPGDIWSLGVCILEFYLGRFPFPVGRKEDLGSLMCAICMSQPPEAPLTASREFRDFIACCLQKEPSKRWTAKRLLTHPFISQCSSTSTSSSTLNSVNLFC